ncbi:hypothetical protein [Flavobacterium crassostreae]|uniref:Lipoprotein n=1 Tax=Flavobacterium crassostreae TaxID=1763534 RepID=A0A1B9E932_9FLAO|nr:hypothetical protein [Flavobacterium crassostreae]OCB78446.1 hypothetical protein LPBF_02235 [Flavobacterium crassostreae]
MLKKLSIISFLILFLPFFQTCSDKNISENKILKNSPLWEEVKKDSKTELNGKEYNLTFEELTLKKQKAITDFVKLKKELTLNGYQIGRLFIEDIETPQWPLMPFSMSILVNIFLVIYSFKEQPKMTFILGILNIFLLLIPLIMLYFGKIFEEIEQLKSGYYLLTFNLIIIIFESYSQMKPKKTSGNS